MKRDYYKKLYSKLLEDKSLLFAIIFSLTFSYFLMYSTFSYKDGNIIIGGKLWSDFLSHIPLIRSFSYGDNIPPEYPIFPGEKIRYHFLFYFLVGMLERAGLRIDIALNTLSIIGMAGLLISIYILAIKLTKSKFAGWLSMIFLLFNSTFSWLYFLSFKHIEGQNIISEVINSKEFASMGPYDDHILSAFWHLNIFTNQRHLAFSFFMMFLSIWCIYFSKSRWLQGLGVFIIGIMSFLHKAVLLILIIILAFLFISSSTDNKKRKDMFILGTLGVILTLPGLIYLNNSSGEGITWKLGFIYNDTTWKELPIHSEGFLKWVIYWVVNLGILPIAAIGGWLAIKNNNSYKTNSNLKNTITNIYKYLFSLERIWLFIGIVVFVLANVLSFAKDTATNHKLVNFTIFIFDIYAAYFVYKLLSKNFLYKFFGVLIFIFMVLGGVVDIFPVFNDNKYTIADIKNSTLSTWVVENTEPDDRFFNLTYDTSAITTAGRKIYYGWDYFHWSIGYDSNKRSTEIKPIMLGYENKEDACLYFKTHNLQYILIANDPSDKFLELNANKEYFQENFVKENTGVEQYIIYNINKSCK